VIRVVRHRFGPRLFVLGRRVHEWHLGVGLILAVLVAWSAGCWVDPLALVAMAGCWLLVKDWRDVFPSRRDSACWQLGLHRPVVPLRPLRRSDSLPALAALVSLGVGLVNLLGAVAPRASLHGHVLMHTDAVRLVPVSHALAIPVAAGLIVGAPYLFRRRRRAWQIALLLLAGLLALSLAKGLEYGEVAAELAALVVLWLGRAGFSVRHEPLTSRSALWRIPLVGLTAWLLSVALVWAAAPPGASVRAVAAEATRLLVWLRPAFPYHDEVAAFPLGVSLIGAATLLCGAYLLFRPLAAPRQLPDALLRGVAARIVRSHGSDTLAFFKLRSDQHYLFSPDRRAFLGYRVENRVLLVAGDPVGPAEALPELLASACSFAELHGLSVAAVGASEALLPLWKLAGLRPLYLGDEAVLDTAAFTLEGRAVRKVRQSVSRLKQAGYQAQLTKLSALSPEQFQELERVSEGWRNGAPERGFAMTMDSLDNDAQQDTLIVLGRDDSGAIRGFLQFVPTYGRPAVSLSLMRRERDTPNGLSEFLIVRAVEELRERGIQEVSLNFAIFAALLQRPSSPSQRLLGRLIRLANPYFQIESLYRFNAKFFPRWEPRYFVYEGTFGLPRAGLAALWAEGQLPKPRLTRHAS
jgi:lysyl-tRNA synthetase class 2